MNSFFGLSSKEEDHYSFIEGFHQTPCDYSPSTRFQTNEFKLILEPDKPIKPFSVAVAGNLAGEAMSSCTESLGSESSEEMMSSLLDVGSFISGKESTSSFCCPSPSACSFRRRENSRSVSEKIKFPPPLTSLSENGRRSFTLEPVRKDGRLEILRVMTERPEILCASRQNGRLRLHLVQTFIQDDEDAVDEGEEEEEEIAAEEAVVEEEENVEEVVAEAAAETAEEVEKGEGKDQWRVITGAGLRRCYHMREMKVWDQQHRFVTTM